MKSMVVHQRSALGFSVCVCVCVCVCAGVCMCVCGCLRAHTPFLMEVSSARGPDGQLLYSKQSAVITANTGGG